MDLKYFEQIQKDIQTSIKSERYYILDIKNYNFFISKKTFKSYLPINSNFNKNIIKNLIYKKDFRLVSSEFWEFLKKLNSSYKEFLVFITKDHITNKDIIIFDYKIINISYNSENLKVTCDLNWKIGYIKQRYCIFKKFNEDEITFNINKNGSNIDDNILLKDYLKKNPEIIIVLDKKKDTFLIPDNNSVLPKISNNLPKKNSSISSKNTDNYILNNDFSNNSLDLDYNLNKNSISLNTLKNSNFLNNHSINNSINSPTSKNFNSLNNNNNNNNLSLTSNNSLNSSSIRYSAFNISTSNNIEQNNYTYPKPIGLQNLGNTCFFNASVQCLIRIKPLINILFSSNINNQINYKNPKGSNGKIINSFKNLIKGMSSNTSYSYDPSDLRYSLISKFRTFANYNQHDSQELLGSLLDGLHEDLNQSFDSKGSQPQNKNYKNGWEFHLSKNYSPIVDLFHGELFNGIECPHCSNIEYVRDPFLFFPAPLPTSYSTNLEEIMKIYSKSETLDLENKWKCPKCHELVLARTKRGIYRLPEIFLIHLKRFKQEYIVRKLETNVDYPEFIKASEISEIHNNEIYKLVGVVFHSGTLTGGHYTSVALDQEQNKWYYFNDSSVNPINKSEIHSQKAYIIIYQKEK